MIVLTGGHNGQVLWWDARTGGRPQGLTPLTVGHTQVVTAVRWLVHKKPTEFFTISIDGQVRSINLLKNILYHILRHVR